MAVIKADVVGHELDYWPAGVPFESSLEVIKYYPQEDPYWAARENVRRVTARLLGDAPVYYLMHWNPGTQLAGVDAKVEDGSVSETDFADAVLTETMGYQCRFCDTLMRAAVVDGGSPIHRRDLAARLRAHEFVRECPHCHHQITGLVAEFLPPL